MRGHRFLWGAMRYILIDIDHTLSDAAWRDHMIGGEGGWDVYHASSHADDPIPGMDALLGAFSTRFELIGITARPEKWRQMTNDWLYRHGFNFDELLMRADSDLRPAPALKLDMARKRFNDDLTQVEFIIDDRADVLDAFQEAGVSGLMVRHR